jgi:excisionase family DNA binding protein
MTVTLDAPIPRVALTVPEAAAALGCGETYFNDYVRPYLRLVRRGRKVLIPVAELEQWVSENADRPVAEDVR